MGALRHRMRGDVVWLGHRLEGITAMPRLPSQRLLPFRAQAAGTRRLAETITGGRLAAVAAVLDRLVAQPLQFSRLNRYRPGLCGDSRLLLPDDLGLLSHLVMQVPPDPQPNLYQLTPIGNRPGGFFLVGRQNGHALVGVKYLSMGAGSKVNLHD